MKQLSVRFGREFRRSPFTVTSVRHFVCGFATYWECWDITICRNITALQTMCSLSWQLKKLDFLRKKKLRLSFLRFNFQGQRFVPNFLKRKKKKKVVITRMRESERGGGGKIDN